MAADNNRAQERMRTKRQQIMHSLRSSNYRRIFGRESNEIDCGQSSCNWRSDGDFKRSKIAELCGDEPGK